MMTWLKLSIQAYIRKGLEGYLPDLAVEILRRFGIIEDSRKIEKAAEDAKTRMKEGAKRLVTPGMEGTSTDTRPFTFKDTDGNLFVVQQLTRSSTGGFRYLDSEYAHDDTASSTNKKEVVDAILAEREKRAKEGVLPADIDPTKYGGLTLLQREYLFNRLAKGNPTALSMALFDPYRYSTLSPAAKERFKKQLTAPEAQAEMQKMREQYPSTYVGMNKGTLGAFGSLFVDFKKQGTPAELHDVETVVTPKQLGDVLNASAQISVRDVVNRLNTNINMLIAVAKADVNLERSKLRAMT